MDPITGALLGTVVSALLKPSGPSAADIAAQQAAAQAAETRAWLIGGGILGGALLIYLLVSRR